MFADDYDEVGVWLVHTWGVPDQRVTWEAVAAYCDEVWMVIDSVDSWRKSDANKLFNIGDVVDAVNAVSSQKIKL